MVWHSGTGYDGDFAIYTITQWKKTLSGRRPNTARLQCACKAEPKIFAPPQTPFPRAQDGQNLISWRWSLYLYLQTQFGEDRWTQFRVIVVTEPHTHTHKHTHKQTHRQDRLQYTAPQPASAQYKNRKNGSHSEQEIYYLYRVQIGDKSVQASIYRLRIDLRFEFFFLKHRGCF